MSDEHVSVVLVRRNAAGLELFLIHRAGGPAAPPHGALHPNEEPRVAAARVALAEAGVLFARDAGQAETLEMWNLASLRKKIRGGADATELLRAAGLAWSSDALLPWSHWIAPAKDAVHDVQRIFVAEIPSGMPPVIDRATQGEPTWLRPADARARAGELALTPALVRTCYELEQCAGVEDVIAAARVRAEEPHPIMPRLAANAPSTLLLPWDPEYETAGQGESLPLSFQPRWAVGPTRFVLEDRTWKHVAAPGSTTAG